ncbi:choline dehydrogenase [Favolaschia claudopus]|uniref:Choline dehydrogenase n=1 Tax=Favolaschia claudopus TaxID=2862362 RepID=A0AAW0A3N9_9AGAR
MTDSTPWMNAHSPLPAYTTTSWLAPVRVAAQSLRDSQRMVSQYVLVIESGVDESKNINTTTLALNFDATDDPKIDLNYTIREYPSDFRIQRNDVWYPRAAGIGGCTIHNAMDNGIGGLRQTFDKISGWFNDSSWTRDNMQKYFALLERNLYLTPPNPDHGLIFDGWLRTIRAPVNFSTTDPQWEAVGNAAIAAAGPLIEDINSHLPLPRSARGLTATGKLEFNLTSLSFKLSGIGDSAQLKKLGIPTVVDMPGVGSNLQDNDEIPVFWELQQNFTDPEKYFQHLPMLRRWSPISTRISSRKSSLGLSVITASTPNFLTIVNLKAMTSSKGYVRLTTSHPQDLLDINKLRFQAPGGQEDIEALREGVKRWRKIINTNADLQNHLVREVSPGGNVTTDEDLENFILEHVFAHHACCTNAIGPDGDPQAVLDGEFKVRGVRNLRVVDASSWPEIPGYFPTSPAYMMAEKAAQVILKEANKV